MNAAQWKRLQARRAIAGCKAAKIVRDQEKRQAPAPKKAAPKKAEE